MSQSTLAATPNTTVDLTDIPAANLACLERIAGLRGVTVAEVVAAIIREDTDRLLATAAGRSHHEPPALPEPEAQGLN